MGIPIPNMRYRRGAEKWMFNEPTSNFSVQLCIQISDILFNVLCSENEIEINFSSELQMGDKMSHMCI